MAQSPEGMAGLGDFLPLPAGPVDKKSPPDGSSLLCLAPSLPPARISQFKRQKRSDADAGGGLAPATPLPSAMGYGNEQGGVWRSPNRSPTRGLSFQLLLRDRVPVPSARSPRGGKLGAGRLHSFPRLVLSFRMSVISGVRQDFPVDRIHQGLGGLAVRAVGLDQSLRPCLPHTLSPFTWPKASPGVQGSVSPGRPGPWTG